MKDASRHVPGWMLGLAAALIFSPFADAQAYIGPGAGFAFLGSGFVVFFTMFMACITLLIWPFQWAWRKARGFGVSRRARTRRLVIVGLDGLEPKLTEQMMDEGELPHLADLAKSGSYARLGTTLPSLSPVAWSTFQTGVNPGAHNIFDFLTRDRRTCLPQMASTELVKHKKKWGFLGGGMEVRITRRSIPFWKILGKYGVFSNILRVPISYPPEKFYGNILSAMCTPDLKGTQGSFTYITTRESGGEEHVTGGDVRRVVRKENRIESYVEGPPHPKKKGESLRVPFSLLCMREGNSAVLEIEGRRETLQLNSFSSWIELEFRAGRVRVSGICRFCLRELGEQISLYISPVNIHPERPALPIAQPLIFASWLAKKLGLFGTLGLMEDTWARNEHALDDERFLAQTYLTHAERERMFFETLEKTREGLCVCVFDASDRIQHMFWRYLEQGHPSPLESVEHFGDTIHKMYQRMDELVGRVKAKLNPKDVLIILSDHGFASFRRCVNLNTWLHENGYLAVKEGGVTGADYFQDVDWSRTKAYAVGLTGIFVNRQGREAQGTVPESEVAKLKAEISTKLEALRDPADNAPAIRKMYDTAKEYHGLYVDEAPDLIPGYAPGYRISWDSITGRIEPTVFSDNVKAWSGDHHVDPELIPGIFLSNRQLNVNDPHIRDIAPTALDLFAVKVPPHMEGRVVL